jgi:hypothetical protein
MKNGRCRLHGGKSTGARTAEGRRRARTARLVHGRRTAAAIGLRSSAAAVSRRLAWMAGLAHQLSAGHGVDRSDSTPPLGGDGRLKLCRSQSRDRYPRNVEAPRSGVCLWLPRDLSAWHGVHRSDSPLPLDGQDISRSATDGIRRATAAAAG